MANILLKVQRERDVAMAFMGFRAAEARRGRVPVSVAKEKFGIFPADECFLDDGLILILKVDKERKASVIFILHRPNVTRQHPGCFP